MGRPKKSGVKAEKSAPKEIDLKSPDLSKIMKSLLKTTGNEYASIADDGMISDSDTYTDSGVYLLNMQLSGSVFGGIQPGVTGIAGESATGKTYFCLSMIDSFLKKNPTGMVFYFDSENAINKQRLESRELDLKRISYVPVTSLLEFRQQATNLVNEINTNYKPGEYRFLFVLDSLGMLPSHKEQLDAASGNEKVDFTRTKEIRSMFRVLTVKMARHQIPFLVTNHTYTNVMAYGAPQKMGGGGGLVFAASQILMLTKAQYKENEQKVGNVVTSTMFKNRDVRPDTKIKMLLSYTRGLHPYFGLLDFALEAGIWKKVVNDKGKESKKIAIGDEELLEKEIYANSKKYFTQEVLEKLDAYIKPNFVYGSDADAIPETIVIDEDEESTRPDEE